MKKEMRPLNGMVFITSLLAIAALACNGKKDHPKDYASVAVLPFDNANNNPELGYFSDGLAEDIRNDLSLIKGLKVCAPASSFQIRGQIANAPEIGQKLHANTLLGGKLQMQDDKIRVDVRLVDAGDGSSIWTREFTENMDNLSSLQEEISSAVAKELHPGQGERPASPQGKKTAPSHAAYALYLKGRSAWNLRTPGDLKRGIDLFRQAIAIDSGYAAAYSGIADCYTALGYGNWLSPRESFPKALEAATKALSLDSTLAEPHASLGYYKFYYEWDWAAAEQEFRASIARNANYEIAYDWYGFYLTAMRRFDEAKIVLQKAQELDPLSPPIRTDLGFNAFYSGNYDEAIRQIRTSLQMNPNFTLGHLWLGRVYHVKKMYHDAVAEYKKGIPGWPVTLALIGNAYGESGNKDSARQILDTLNAWYSKKFVTAYGMASVYVGMGDKDHTFEWLDKAVEERSNWLVWLRLDPRWDRIRTDKRYAVILNRLGLPL